MFDDFVQRVFKANRPNQVWLAVAPSVVYPLSIVPALASLVLVGLAVRDAVAKAAQPRLEAG